MLCPPHSRRFCVVLLLLSLTASLHVSRVFIATHCRFLQHLEIDFHPTHFVHLHFDSIACPFLAFLVLKFSSSTSVPVHLNFSLHLCHYIPSAQPVSFPMDVNNENETDDIMNCESEILNHDDGHYHSTQAVLPNYKSLVAKLRALEDCGVESSSIALPKMIVVGDQNAGKSSLIERISDITVPRASGTCTRCPIRITLQEHDGPWSCSVTLEKKYFYAESNKWVLLRPDERNDFARLTNPEHLEEIINRAQLALINPGRAWHEFRQPTVNTKEVDFSPNIVCVNVCSTPFKLLVLD